MEQTDHIAAIVLAAGQARRFGRNKLVQPFSHGKTLLGHSVHVAKVAECTPVIVVTGAFEAEVKEALAGLEVLFVHNEHWEGGMGSSIARGVGFLMQQAKPPKGFFILMADQPKVDAPLLREMMQLFKTHSPAAIRCNYGNAFGPPVLFRFALAEELMQLTGDEGAKTILKKYAGQVLEVPFPEGTFDIDSPEDLEKLKC